jgi:16S rRNA processing protein RimM
LPDNLILLGVIGRAHGVSGRVRVASYTADPVALTGYGPLSDETGRRFVLRWTSDCVAEVSEVIDGKAVKITNRAAAERLTNTRLCIERERLPPPDPGEYYLADLIGLTAADGDGARVGVVTAVHDYGGGASLELTSDDARSFLVPFNVTCVPDVDVVAGRLIVAPPDEIDASDGSGLLGGGAAMGPPDKPGDDGVGAGVAGVDAGGAGVDAGGAGVEAGVAGVDAAMGPPDKPGDDGTGAAVAGVGAAVAGVDAGVAGVDAVERAA